MPIFINREPGVKDSTNVFHEIGIVMNLISAEYYHKMYNSTNGLLLPGGARDLLTSGEEADA